MDTGSAVQAKDKVCQHDSTRVDGLLDVCCLKCGVSGYWRDGRRHDEVHPSGRMLFRLDVAESRE